MVREIPNFPTPPLEQVDEQYAAELDRQEERAASAAPRKKIPWPNTSVAPTKSPHMSGKQAPKLQSPQAQQRRR
jgi:hypothetical protein